MSGGYPKIWTESKTIKNTPGFTVYQQNTQEFRLRIYQEDTQKNLKQALHSWPAVFIRV